MFIEQFYGKSLLLEKTWITSDKLKLSTDSASLYGYAAILGNQWFHGKWPPLWRNYLVTVLELYPVLASLEFCAKNLKNKCVLLLCDNMAVVDIINKLTSKDNIVMRLMRRLVLCCMQNNILLKAKHIPGKRNVLADLLSHFQVAQAKQVAPWILDKPAQLPASILPWDQ